LGYDDQSFTGEVFVSWNDMWSLIAPKLFNEITDRHLRRHFTELFETKTREAFSNDKDFNGKTLRNFKFLDHDIDTCIIQFRALGLLKENVKQRSVKDTNTYWTMTPYGDQLMVQLRAIRKRPIDKKISKGKLIHDKSK